MLISVFSLLLQIIFSFNAVPEALFPEQQREVHKRAEVRFNCNFYRQNVWRPVLKNAQGGAPSQADQRMLDPRLGMNRFTTGTVLTTSIGPLLEGCHHPPKARLIWKRKKEQTDKSDLLFDSPKSPQKILSELSLQLPRFKCCTSQTKYKYCLCFICH